MIDMKTKDVIKLDTVPLDKTYPEENLLPEYGLYRCFFINLANNMKIKKAGPQTLSVVKICID